MASYLVDCMVCVSKDSAGLSGDEGVPRRRLRTILNGVDIRRFAYLGPRPGGPAVVVARLSPEKDVETLLGAAALAVQEQPSFSLEIAGGGPELPRLERLSGQIGLQGHVRFLGEVRDVPSVLARASLFVLPSLTEGISLTLLEAMARGLPVVATRVGGNPEVVVDQETGFLVPTKSPQELAQAMLRLRNDPELARRMGLAGRRRVEQVFDVRRMVADYEKLYLELMG
jgi:glycosyltransferase involved in cell wall biosynthesis